MTSGIRLFCKWSTIWRRIIGTNSVYTAILDADMALLPLPIDDSACLTSLASLLVLRIVENLPRAYGKAG